jgi:MSHA biogenesis protein MshN
MVAQLESGQVSLINQMLKDLDARGREGQPVAHMPPEVRAIPVPRSLLAKIPGAWWGVLFLALVLLLLVLWVVTHRGAARSSTTAQVELAQPGTEPQALPTPPAAANNAAPQRGTLPPETIAEPAPAPEHGPASAGEAVLATLATPVPTPVAMAAPASTPSPVADKVLMEPDPGLKPERKPELKPELRPDPKLNLKLSLKLIPELDLLAAQQRLASARKSDARPVQDESAVRTGTTRVTSAASSTGARPAGPDESVKWGKVVQPLNGPQRAEREYRQGVQAWQAGRQGEAIAALEQALQYDAQHSNARQTLVGWLLELGQRAEAIRRLQEGLSHDPAQAGLAMMLARLQVDQGDAAAALKTLQISLPYTVNRADYHAFLAALWQREQKHAQAIEHYRIALRLMPDNGVWWMGLGISHQASGQKSAAREAFQRAAASAALGPELQAFVSERLLQLQ